MKISLTQYVHDWLSRGSRRESLVGYIFIFPMYLGFILFVLGPMIATIVLSFTNYGMFESPEFVGFKNFIKMFSDVRLKTVYGNTFFFTIFSVMGNVGFGLLLAMLLNQILPKGIKNVLRSAYFFPSLVGLVYVSIIWQFLYQKDVGIINYYLSLIGINPISWLSSKTWALPSAIILDVWKNLGMDMLILLAGLQGISEHYYEAARIDGANNWQMFRKITLPLLSPQLLFVSTINITGALRVFDSIVVLTNGGPGDASRSVVMYIYEKAFRSFDLGYASAVSVSLLLVIMLVTLIHFRVSKRWVHYE